MKFSVFLISYLIISSSILRCGRLFNKTDDAFDAARYSRDFGRTLKQTEQAAEMAKYTNVVYDASRMNKTNYIDYFGITRNNKILQYHPNISREIFKSMGNYPNYQMVIDRDIYDLYYEIYRFEKNSEINNLIIDFPQHKEALLKIKNTENVRTKSKDLDYFRVMNNIKVKYFSDERTFHMTKNVKQVLKSYDLISKTFEVLNYTESNDYNIPNDTYQRIYTLTHPKIEQFYAGIHSHIFVSKFKKYDDWKAHKEIGSQLLSINQIYENLYEYTVAKNNALYFGLLKIVSTDKDSKFIEIEFYNQRYYQTLGKRIISKIE